MVDQHPLGFGPRVVEQHVGNHSGAAVLVFQMRRVDQHEFAGFQGEVVLLFKNGRLVERVLVEADLADPEHVRLVEKLGDEGNHFAGERNVFGFLGVDAEPGEVLNARPTGALGFEIGQLPEVVAKRFGAAAIEPGPEGRFTEGDAPHAGHPFVVVGGPRNHVDMRIDEVHASGSSSGE